MPLVIYGLGSVHTCTHARAHTDTHTTHTHSRMKEISRNQACAGLQPVHAWFKNYIKHHSKKNNLCDLLLIKFPNIITYV